MVVVLMCINFYSFICFILCVVAVGEGSGSHGGDVRERCASKKWIFGRDERCLFAKRAKTAQFS